jgi:hypothetical protein
MQGDGFGFEFEYVYEFGGGEPGEGCGELGVVELKTGDCILGRKGNIYCCYGKVTCCWEWDSWGWVRMWTNEQGSRYIV